MITFLHVKEDVPCQQTTPNDSHKEDRNYLLPALLFLSLKSPWLCIPNDALIKEGQCVFWEVNGNDVVTMQSYKSLE